MLESHRQDALFRRKARSRPRATSSTRGLTSTPADRSWYVLTSLRLRASAVMHCWRGSWPGRSNVALAALLALAPLAGAADAGPGPLPAACAVECVSRYGEVLGVAAPGVPAYSNCSSACVSFEPHLLDGRFLGMKWQCVEYARRWLFTAKGAVFGDVDVAADGWRRVDALTRVADGSRIPLTAHPNGSPTPPRAGDLLVYGDEYLGTGHLAVVLRVDPEAGTVEVAEQNYDNRAWPAEHARRLDLIERSGRFWVLDSYLIGWKRAELP